MANLILITWAFIFSMPTFSDSGVGSGDDCATCGSNMPVDVSAANSLGDGQLSKIAMAVVSDQGTERNPNSLDETVVHQRICTAWVLNDWNRLESLLKDNQIKISEAYHKIKCTFDGHQATPLFYKVAVDPFNYRVTYKRLMRQYQKEGGDQELTCALTHLRYRNNTMVEQIKFHIETATLNNSNETDPTIRADRELIIKELNGVLAYWKRHTDKYPLQNNGDDCPEW